VEPGLALQVANLTLTGALVVFLIRVEHRFTALETQMKIVLHRLRLADE
jgi:hypothetical protein